MLLSWAMAQSLEYERWFSEVLPFLEGFFLFFGEKGVWFLVETTVIILPGRW